MVKDENLKNKEVDPPNTTNINIINKNKGIDEKINIPKDYNDILSIIDKFYIEKYNTMVYNKNNYISKIVKNNYNKICYLRKTNNDKNNIINKLIEENKSLKKKIAGMISGNEISKKETPNTTNKMVDTESKRNIKLKKIYNKYISIYEIFNKYNNYKLVNLDEIRKYTNDKNIYKVKQRCTKIYKFYEEYKNGIIDNLLSVTAIFKLSF